MHDDSIWPDLPCYFHKKRSCSCSRRSRALGRFAYTDWFNDDSNRAMTPEQRLWCMRQYHQVGRLVDPLTTAQMERFSDRFLAGTALIAMIERERTGEKA